MTSVSVQAALKLGMKHHSAGELDQAEAIYQQILSAVPDEPHAFHLLGVIALDLQQHAKAIELISRAIALLPGHPDFHFNLGVAWAARSQWDQAIDSYRMAITIEPGNENAQNNLGGALLEAGRVSEAIESYQRALALRPDSALFHNNLSSALCRLDRFTDAASEARRAAELQTDFAEAYVNLGAAMLCNGDYSAAISSYQAAITVRPDYAQAHHSLGLALLATGEMERGWKESEWRLRVPGRFKLDFPQPIWDGSELGGARIVLWHEQGFGDTFQFARYAPMVAAKGGRVVLLVPHELKCVLETLEGVEQVVSNRESIPPFDVHCPLMSLPLLFKTTLNGIPSKTPYLFADEERIAIWRQRIGAVDQRLNIGLVWAGRPALRNDRHRSFQLAEFAPLAMVQNVRWFSLQMGAPASQPRPAGLALIDLTAEIRDFADTAAILNNLDLLISADTAVVHLAGALGRQAWVLLPFVMPDWRWCAQREDSRWYPTLRLFRQREAGIWTSVMQQVVAALSHQ